MVSRLASCALWVGKAKSLKHQTANRNIPPWRPGGFPIDLRTLGPRVTGHLRPAD